MCIFLYGNIVKCEILWYGVYKCDGTDGLRFIGEGYLLWFMGILFYWFHFEVRFVLKIMHLPIGIQQIWNCVWMGLAWFFAMNFKTCTLRDHKI